MPTTSELLRAAEQLPPNELSQFAAKISALNTERMAPTAELSEDDLLALARQALPPEVQQRFADLRARNREETLTPDERIELLNIITRSEHMNVSRIGALATLARRRQVSLPEIMTQLGIKAPDYE